MIDRIKEKLEQLRRLAYKFSNESQFFTKYQYLPFLEVEIDTFEKSHQIELPETYRDFLLYISNGGLGPGNGILPLNIKKVYHKLHLPWINPLEYNELFLFDGTKDTYDSFDQKINEVRKKDKANVDRLMQGAENGTLPLADNGCGTYYFLVIKGNNKGEIWLNRLVNESGFKWVANSFGEWFEHWLDEAIALTKENNQSFERLYSDETIHTFIPENLEELQSFVTQFKNLKDQRPVKTLVKRILYRSVSQEIVNQIIDYLLGNEHYQDFDLALQFIAKSSKNLDESHKKKSLCQQGKAAFKSGDYAQALKCFETALPLDDSIYNSGALEAQYLSLMSYCLIKLKTTKTVLDIIDSVDESVCFLEEIYQKYKDYEIAVDWGELVLNADRFKEDDEYEDYLQDIYLILIYAHAATKNTKTAQEYLDKLIDYKRNPSTIPYENIVDELLSSKCYSFAILCLKKYSNLLRSKQNMEWFYYSKGLCFLELDKLEKALDCFIKSYGSKHWIAPYAQLININKHLGKLEVADQINQEIAEFNPLFLSD